MGVCKALLAVAMAVAAGTALAQPYPVLGGTPMSKMSEKDLALYQEALTKALDAGKDGQQSKWSNPESGASGTIEPRRSFKAGGKECRDVYLENRVKGRHEKGTWAYCREPGGPWQLSPGATGK